MRENRAKVAVVGVGHSKVYRRAEEPLGKLAVDAARAAIADAGLKVSDIDGVATSPTHPAGGVGHTNGIHHVDTYFMIKALGLNPSYNDQGTFMVSQTFVQAVNAVAAGACNYALVFRALHNPDGRYGRFAPAVAAGDSQWELPYGASGPSNCGMLLRRYMDKYGGTREQLGTFVVRNRDNGLKWENGYWYQHRPERLTLDDYMNSRPIVEPMCIYDCDMPIQGAGAFIITSAERARDLPNKPAYVLGTAISPEFFSPVGFPLSLESQIEVGRIMGEHLYRNAGIGPKDVDVANLYDGFTPIVPFWAESLGFCAEGEALAWVADPDIPLNTSSGNQGAGRMHGIPHIYDSVLQVTGRAGIRQVPGAEVALAAIAPAHIGGGIVFGSEPN